MESERHLEIAKQKLKSVFGYDSFRFEQEAIIQNILQKKDTLAIMPTGGGKSICYQLPALIMPGMTIVISPLIALMQDQVNNLKQLGIAAEFLNSSLSADESKTIEARVKNKELKLLYMAPEGVLTGNSLAFLNKIEISLIAIDEAHCVSQWGHEFRKDYTRLNELKSMFPKVPTIALTATANAKTRSDICSQLDMHQAQVFVSSFNRPNIKYIIHERTNEIQQLDAFVREHHENDTGIVYCLSRKKVEQVAEKLCELGYNAIPYHAGLTSELRTKQQKRFDEEDRIIVVATIAFGMGIDRPDVRFVAHLDLPKSLEGYYQETGRAGRDGESANAWMVYGLVDVVKLAQMIETSEADVDYKKIASRKLDSMLSMCESTGCRRKEILSYFGEELEKCGNCDTCLEPQETWDASVEAQKALSAIYRTGQFFGSTYIIDVLRGSKNAKILERKHDQLKVFGLGAELSKNQWNSILRQLLHLNYIKIKNWDYRNLALTELSTSVLRGEEKIYLRKLRKVKKDSKRTSRGDNKRKVADANSLAAEHERPELFESLRQLRRTIAKEQNLPPYLVFSDRSLNDMCALLPQDPENLLLVHGVGQSKLEKYGSVFIEEIGAYLGGRQ